MKTPTLSLVIVSFNTQKLLRQCLESIATHAPEAQVIVVDNASSDGSSEMVRESFPNVILVPLSRNLGFAGANNSGLEHATGDFVLLLNSDTVLEDNSLDRCVSWLLDHPEVGAASPSLLGIDDKWQQCFYRFPSFWEALRITARKAPRAPRDDQDADSWLAGTALIIRREALADLGNRLDDTYFMYWEDADVSARIRKAGWKLARCPDTHIRHYGGASGGGSDSQRRGDLYAWIIWGKYRWFAHHRPFWERIGIWLLDWVEVVRKLVRGAIRPSRRYEWAQARILAWVLATSVLGIAPPRP